MIILGLTGSIGMGKSTVAKMFADAGAQVWDADAAVHRLYASSGAGARAIEALAPGVITDDAVDRQRLRAAILEEPALLKRVEAAIHPLVAMDRQAFLETSKSEGADIAVCDIPLLFEGGGSKGFDAVIVVSAPADVQRQRVLARPGMTTEAFEAILAKQMPDADKRARADFIVDTSVTLDETRQAVQTIVDWARKQGADHA